MALNILVVDDSMTVRAVISKTLDLAGIPVKELYQAANGKEALTILEDNCIDLVFADINMPVMNGIEMVDKMSENGLLNNIPVIIVSSEGSVTRIDQLKDKGVNAFVRKPFTPEQIKQIVDDIMGEQNAD